MNDKIKKTIIALIAFVIVFLSCVGYLIYSNYLESKKPTEKNYYYILENESILNEIFNENETIIFKNSIQDFLVEQEYTDDEIDTILIENYNYKNGKKYNLFILLDDSWQSLYRATYDKKTDSVSFEWNGDINNDDYSISKNEKNYLYITNREKYDEHIFNEKIANEKADGIDPESETDE